MSFGIFALGACGFHLSGFRRKIVFVGDELEREQQYNLNGDGNFILFITVVVKYPKLDLVGNLVGKPCHNR